MCARPLPPDVAVAQNAHCTTIGVDALKDTAAVTCGEGELVGGVHTLVGGVVQVYHRLQVQEEEERWQKVEQEIERENQGEEDAQMTMHMEMG